MKIHKSMNNLEIVDLFNAISAAYKLKPGAGTQFKVVAYERAADAVEHLSSEAKDLWDDGKLEEVAGIGKSIAGHLNDIFTTGTSKHFNEIMKGIPAATFELLKVSGIGPKTAFRIAKEYEEEFKSGNSLKTLKKIAKEGKISKMDGFTKLTEEAILQAVDEVKEQKDKRLLLNYAEYLSLDIVAWMQKDNNTIQADALGSVRRKASTVGDIDLAVATNNSTSTIDHFTKYPKTSRVVEKGERSASITIGGGRRVDIIVVKPKAYGALLQHFTGSKHHNVALREYAQKHDLSLSEYGIYEIRHGKKVLNEYSTEKEFYKKLKMAWIPPELREGQGEIEAALKNKLPVLLKLDDINCDLHIHSNFDIKTSHDLGQSTMFKYVDKACDLGYEYIAFSEHNPAKSTNSNMDVITLLKRKKEKIDKINYSLMKSHEIQTKKVFNSLEIDMLIQGGTSLSNEAFDYLDFALVSIHSGFGLNRKRMTQRVIASMQHPKVKIFAHPTGRKLNEREGVELDWEKLFEFFIDNNKWIEINSSPTRLDLPSSLVRDAVKAGACLTLGTDAHHVDQMDLMRYGVYVARRGWAEIKNVVNTRSLKEFEKMLK